MVTTEAVGNSKVRDGQVLTDGRPGTRLECVGWDATIVGTREFGVVTEAPKGFIVLKPIATPSQTQ